MPQSKAGPIELAPGFIKAGVRTRTLTPQSVGEENDQTVRFDSLVLVQLLLRSPWRQALLICLAVPLSEAKNGLRIFTIAMLASRVDPLFLTGKLHRDGGIVFFAIALLAAFALFWILRLGEYSQRISKLDHGESTSTQTGGQDPGVRW